MKRLVVVLAVLLLGAFARAEDRVSLVLNQIPLVELARIAYEEIGGVPVVFTHDAVQSRESVSISLRDVPRALAMAQVEELLRRAGFPPEKRGNVVWIGKATAEEENEFVYRPRFRSVGYLVDLLSPVFKHGAFTLQRNMQSPPVTAPGAQSVQPGNAQPTANAPTDGGTSAYSLFDKNPDAFVFRGDEKALARLKRLLVQLDTAVPELLVKAVVFEVATSRADKSAISLAMSILNGRVQLGNASAGDFSALVKLSSLSAVVDMLSTDSRFKVVSAPTLRVKSGDKARITVGTQTPVLGAASTDRNGNLVQSVEYRPSGVILDLQPQVRQDVSELKVLQQISDFIPTSNGVNSSPTLVTRELQTTVGVKADDVLILGGLDQDKSSQDRAGLSWLPAWLGSSGETKTKSEILLILQATSI